MIGAVIIIFTVGWRNGAWEVRWLALWSLHCKWVHSTSICTSFCLEMLENHKLHFLDSLQCEGSTHWEVASSSEVEATFLPFCLSLLDSMAAMWGLSTSFLLRSNLRDSSISIPLWSDFLSLGSQLWRPFFSFLGRRGTWIKVTEAATSRSWFHMDLRDSSSWNLLW